MRVVRTILVGEEKGKRALCKDLGVVVFVESEDELWRQLLAWDDFPALEDFTFRAYLGNRTLVICPKAIPKKRVRHLRGAILLESFSYPIRLVRGFSSKKTPKIFKEEDLKRGFMQALWHRAYELAEGHEKTFEVLCHSLKQCPFCEKEGLEVIDELEEFKRRLSQIPEDQRTRFIFGFFGLCLRCSFCKKILFQEPQRHFYRVPVEYILKNHYPSAL